MKAERPCVGGLSSSDRKWWLLGAALHLNSAFLFFPLIYRPRLFAPSFLPSPPSSTIASLVLRVCCRQARVSPPLLSSYRTASSASARSTRFAPNPAECTRPSYRLRVKRAPIAVAMSSSGDDTPLVRGSDQGELIHESAFCTRYGYLTLTRRSPLWNSTLPSHHPASQHPSTLGPLPFAFI